MLTVNKYRNTLLEEFYLDSDDITVRRKQDGWRGKWGKGDVVQPYKLTGNLEYTYGGVHIPKTRVTVAFHHLLTLLRGIEIPNGCVLDHQDGNTQNNVRSNVRVTTQKINARNSKMPKNNTSGYTGIHWDKNASQYSVRIRLDGVRRYEASKTLEGALVILEKMKTEGLVQGYSARHGK